MQLEDAEAMARALLAQHGLDGWSVGWDRAVRRAGLTRFRDRRISLSRHLTALHREDEVRETLLHEIAHALVGPGHGHDEVWRRQALAIGATGQRLLAPAQPTVPGRWRGVCPGGHEITRHRAPTRVASCPRCSRGFDLAHRYDWTRDGEVVTMHPAYREELERLLQAARRPPAPVLAPGTRVRIVGRGRLQGRTGLVRGRRRTRYVVSLRGGDVLVPGALLEPLPD